MLCPLHELHCVKVKQPNDYELWNEHSWPALKY